MRRGKGWLLIALIVIVIAALAGRWIWTMITGPAAKFSEDSRILLIPSGSSLDQVTDSLIAIGAIDDEQKFRWLAEKKNYADRIRAGRYRITRGMSMNSMVNMLRAGEQEPVKVTFTNIDHLPELAGKLAQYLEPDSITFLRAFEDRELHQKAGLDRNTFISLFIPNTYEFWWTTTPDQIIDRMKK